MAPLSRSSPCCCSSTVSLLSCSPHTAAALTLPLLLPYASPVQPLTLSPLFHYESPLQPLTLSLLPPCTPPTLQPTQKYMLSTYNAYQVLDELCQSEDEMGLYVEDDAAPTYNFHTWFKASRRAREGEGRGRGNEEDAAPTHLL